MSPAALAAITTIIDLIARYGVPVALELIKSMPSDPTAEDWAALQKRVPPPSTYFSALGGQTQGEGGSGD